MKEIIDELNAIHREVGRAGEARTIVLRRSYPASIEDVWDAITTADRISRWLLPVTGDLRLGGTYQLEGNAGGRILTCESPQLLKVTWEYGEEGSEVEVRLSAPAGDETVFELEHMATIDPERWSEYGPGAVGAGWDLSLLGLSRHLAKEPMEDLESPAVREFLTGSCEAWGAAMEAAGATAAEARTAVASTTKFYVPS